MLFYGGASHVSLRRNCKRGRKISVYIHFCLSQQILFQSITSTVEISIKLYSGVVAALQKSELHAQAHLAEPLRGFFDKQVLSITSGEQSLASSEM